MMDWLSRVAIWSSIFYLFSEGIDCSPSAPRIFQSMGYREQMNEKCQLRPKSFHFELIWLLLLFSLSSAFLPFDSSSSIVALESVDSLTWDPSLFFDIKFLLLKFLDTSMVVKMAPYNNHNHNHLSYQIPVCVFVRLLCTRSAKKCIGTCTEHVVTRRKRTRSSVRKRKKNNQNRLTLSFRRALNFFKQSTVSCRCTIDATRSLCYNYYHQNWHRRIGKWRNEESARMGNSHIEKYIEH